MGLTWRGESAWLTSVEKDRRAELNSDNNLKATTGLVDIRQDNVS